MTSTLTPYLKYTVNNENKIKYNFYCTNDGSTHFSHAHMLQKCLNMNMGMNECLSTPLSSKPHMHLPSTV